MKKNGKIVATIEARMTSSRLPGKVLLEANKKTMLEHLIERLRAVKSVDEIALATTINGADDPLIDLALRKGVKYFRGSEEDVMDRVIKTAESAGADIVVEITGDCPIIDPLVIEQAVQMFLHNDCDYVSNGHIRTYPDGMDTQVFRLETLKRSYPMTTTDLEREHVTLHIRYHPDLFRHLHLIAPPDLYWPGLGLTLDEKDDYLLLKKIIEHFGNGNPMFSCREVISLLRENPHWIDLNKHVRRKGDT